MHREHGADSGVGGEGRPIRRQRARSTQYLCCAHICACLHHLSVTYRVRSIGSGRRAPCCHIEKNDKVFSFLRKRKNFEIFSTCSDGGDIEAGDGACRRTGHGRPARGKKSKKNDKVFSFLRKRKNFEIFSTCSDGGDIEAGDGACGERGTAGRPRGESQKNDQVFSLLRKR